ncbi:MAG: hypothetical protein ACPGJS_02555 [Flammeovirgaceae bacterium]
MMRLCFIFLWCGAFLLMGFSLKESAAGQFSAESVLIFKKRLNKKYDTGYHLDVAYPEVRCRNINQGYEINKHIHQLTSGAITEFTKKVQKLFKPSEGYHYMNLDYVVHFTDSYTISVQFNKSAQFIGYKESLDLSTTFNYDLAQDKVVRFDDLFDEDAHYQKKIAHLMWKYYKVKIETSDIGKATKFCMNSHFLTLFYKHPTANRLESYRLKWSEIASVLNKSNPVLSEYAKN